MTSILSQPLLDQGTSQSDNYHERFDINDQSPYQNTNDYQSDENIDNNTTNDQYNENNLLLDPNPPTSFTLPNNDKFKPNFLTRFLPWSYYLVYLILTSMQELPMTSISWILNNTTKFTPEELTIYYNLCFLPWTIKPLWGFIADNVPICGYRRKPYMIFTSFLAAGVFAAIPLFAHDKLLMRVLGVLQAFCVVVSEVQVDGLVVMYSNTMMDQQAALYRQFPEFKQLVQEQKKKEKDDKNGKNDKKDSNRNASDDSSNPLIESTLSDNNNNNNNDESVGLNDNLTDLADNFNPHTGQTDNFLLHTSNQHKNEEPSSPLLDSDSKGFVLYDSIENQQGNDTLSALSNSSSTKSQNSFFSSSSSTSSKISSSYHPTNENAPATHYNNTDEIFAANPHYYELLNPNEYHLMMTMLPKAAIQSEAMTFRTAASLCSSVVSLLLHLFLSPHKVVWVSAGLPAILVVVILIFLPEKNTKFVQEFRHRLKVISTTLSHYTSTHQPLSDDNDEGLKGVDNHSNFHSSNGGNTSSQLNYDDDNQSATERFMDQCHCDEHKPSLSTFTKKGLKINETNETNETNERSLILTNPSFSDSSTMIDSDQILSNKTNQENKTNKTNKITRNNDLCVDCLCNRIKAIFGGIVLIWKPLLFMLLLRSMPSVSDPMMSYIFGHLTLPPWLLSAYSFISIGGGLLGTIIYWKFFINISIIPSFILFTILSASLGAIPNFILTNEWINIHIKIPSWSMVFIGTFISAIFSRFALMPTLILAAETAPQHFGLEATMFSIYTATNNIGNVIAVFSNVYLIKRLHITNDDFHGLSTMIVICSIASIIPLIFTPLIYCTQNDIKRIEIKRQVKKERRYLKRLQQRRHRHRQQGHMTKSHLIQEKTQLFVDITSTSDSDDYDNYDNYDNHDNIDQDVKLNNGIQNDVKYNNSIHYPIDCKDGLRQLPNRNTQ